MLNVEKRAVQRLKEALVAIKPSILDGDGPHILGVADRCITVWSYNVDPNGGKTIARFTTPEWSLDEYDHGTWLHLTFSGNLQRFEEDVVLFRLGMPI